MAVCDDAAGFTMTRPSRRRYRCAWALLAAMAAATPAFADFQEDYARGLQAVDAHRWTDARKYLQGALAQQPDPVDKVILNGSVEQPYVPYHFLGVVAINLGECEVAAAQFNHPTHRRMIARVRVLRTQEQEMLAACKPSVAKEDKPPAPVEPAEPPASKPDAAPPKGSADKRPDKLAPGETTKQVAVARAPTPAPLLRAFDDYVSGRYSEAARIDPEFFTDHRQRFHAYLLRSAARFALAQLGDRSLLEEARSDARAALALDRTAPDPAVFSPRFRAFYGGAQ
ncbi:MAG TPA: hypothetical protein VF132_03585 [Rudaea sp.]